MAIRVRERVAFGMYERVYLPEIFRGLGVTMRHFFKNLLWSNKTRYTQTVRYPEEKRTYPERFRGQHRLLPRADGSPRCVACYMCATACPAHCIHIIADESPDHQIEKYPAAFEIDQLRCVYCGLCEEACPEDAIRMDSGIHTPSFLSRDDGVTGRMDLLTISGFEGTRLAYGAQNFREDTPPEDV